MIGEKTPAVEAFWADACKQHSITANDYHCSTFGDPRFADYGDHVTQLAIDETKRATAHLAMDFEINGSRAPPGWRLLGDIMGKHGAGLSVENGQGRSPAFQSSGCGFCGQRGRG